MSTAIQTSWNLGTFIKCYIAAFLLVASLYLPMTAPYWAAVDNWVFYRFNGSLADNAIWAQFWAYTNIHLTNVIAGIIMVSLILWHVYADRSTSLASRLNAFFNIAFFVLLAIAISKTGFRDFENPSPSYVLEPFYNLNEHYAHIDAKIRTNHSFPGDHGVTTLLYSALACFFIRKRNIAIFIVLFAIANNLPRLFSGAHWLSDVIVGGGAITLAILPFAIATPFAFYTEKVFSFLQHKAEEFIPRLKPVFAHLEK